MLSMIMAQVIGIKKVLRVHRLQTKKQRMVNYMKVKKIETTLPLKVQGQACTNNCEEKIWAGKKEADGWEAGCWYTIGYTARGAWW